MLAELFALLASLGYAASYVFAKKALKGSDPLTGVLLSVVAGSSPAHPSFTPPNLY
ncbi:MAG: hypothetical protein HYY65_10050 [Candidatus Tectomicrobia bacterium]|uniref:Uncharacterized protein n=1 Tax=Tectimicrobiota bacterium TaxID=2528274 RepID=A0A932GQA3_UNCTE|nr:hypothetical protein [Candidatus Tectomicrobia bacterium]